NRVIPLHKRIVGFVEKRMSANKYLMVGIRKQKLNYDTFRRQIWDRVMDELELDHLPHDCRHTFSSRMKRVGADNLARKRIMGHSSQDITDDVYTHKTIEELVNAVDLLE